MSMAAAIVSWLSPFWTLITTLALLIGFTTVGLSLMAVASGAAEGSHGAQKVRAGWGGVVIGFLLVNFPGLLSSLSMTVFNASTQTAIAYTPPGNSQYADIVHAVLGVMSLLGAYGIIKGLLQLRHAHEHRDLFWSGIRHLIAGIFMVNVVPFLHLLGVSFGSTLQSVVTNLIG